MADQDSSQTGRDSVPISLTPEELRAASQLVARLMELFPSTGLATSKPETYGLACRIYAARRERRHFFPEGLFADPAWDMLLILYGAEGRGEFLSVSSLCISADVPQTTALRWVGVLQEAGLVTREKHEADGRSYLVKLTDLARDKMEDCLARMGERQIPLRTD